MISYYCSGFDIENAFGLKVARDYGKFYLLQDVGKSISYIKSVDGKIEFRSENDGKMWEVGNDIQLHETNNAGITCSL